MPAARRLFGRSACRVICSQADGAQLAEVAKLIASGKYRLNVAHRLPLDKASPRVARAPRRAAIPVATARACAPRRMCAGLVSACTTAARERARMHEGARLLARTERSAGQVKEAYAHVEGKHPGGKVVVTF